MEACPRNTTNLIGVHKMACNRCVRVDQSFDFVSVNLGALAFGLGGGA